MKKLFLIFALLTAHVTYAEPVATQPNQAGGKIVLTNEPCIAGGKTYDTLSRAYNFGTTGNSTEGCYYVDLTVEVVVVVWAGSQDTSRYPLSNFTLIKRNNTNGKKLL